MSTELEQEDIQTLKILGYCMVGFSALTVVLIITAQLVA